VARDDSTGSSLFLLRSVFRVNNVLVSCKSDRLPELTTLVVHVGLCRGNLLPSEKSGPGSELHPETVQHQQLSELRLENGDTVPDRFMINEKPMPFMR